MIYISVILTILTIGVLAVAFFLMAIWRAILGKSSVDLKLATTIDIETKRIEALHKSMGSYSNEQNSLRNDLREIGKSLKELITKIDEKKHK